jgi:murein DD-endopeptidase MepM/ murein hydrolase activator NlpD
VTRLSLPFHGIWGIIQGFDSGETHVRYAAFALDFVPAQPKTTPAPKPGAPLEAFACYGRPVLAPADGTVVRANGDARDWPAYRKGSDPGNYVIIQHAPGEYTEFRHLAADSVKLTAGALVRRGDVIGRCGNSGNAGMPHLHIGFLSSIDPITTRPMRLSDYQRAGTDEAWHPGTGFPVKGELLRPLPSRGGPEK